MGAVGAAAVVVVVFVACSSKGEKPISATEAERVCTVATDCVIVVSGNACSKCDCSRDAVSVGSVAEYRKRYADLASSDECSDKDNSDCSNAGACEQIEAVCTNRLCVVRSRRDEVPDSSFTDPRDAAPAPDAANASDASDAADE